MPEPDPRPADAATADAVRRSFTPDPIAVERIVDYALTPRRRRHRGLSIVSVVLALAAAAILWRARPVTDVGRAGLSNHGDVYVGRAAAGTWIHNNPETRTRADGTTQIIIRGETR